MAGLTRWLAGAAVLATAGFAALKAYLGGYVDPGEERVAAAGYAEKTAHGLNYVEGPANGPPLLLLHAQHMDWFSYNLVLPELARSFHVFAVDYPGHGKTVVAGDYPMTAQRIGADLAGFLEAVVAKPAYVAGNSSGGLLAAWLAANRPDLVKAVLLEDPPLFSAEHPRIKDTIAYRSFVTSHDAVQRNVGDFLLFWIDSNSAFFAKNVGRGSAFALTQAVKSYRSANPGKPVAIRLLRNDTVRQFVRGLDEYDPRFGAAFFDGTFNEGFDHASTLARITCPVLLLQANSETTPEGVLRGAMTRHEADRARSLLHNGTYLKLDAGHVVHLDRPAKFTQLVRDFFPGN